MKLNFKTKIHSLLLCFLIVVTNITICNTKALNSPKDKAKSKVNSSTNQGETKKRKAVEEFEIYLDETEDDFFADDEYEEAYKSIRRVSSQEIEYIWYILGFMSCMPFIGGFVYAIETLLEANDSCKTTEAISQFKEAIVKRANLPLKTLDTITEVKEKLVWKDNKLELDKENLYDSCIKISKARKTQYEENIKYKEKYALALKALKKINDESVPVETFFSLGVYNPLRIHGDKSMRVLKDYFLEVFSESTTNLKSLDSIKEQLKADWSGIVNTHMNILIDNEKRADMNIKALSLEKGLKINCNNLKNKKSINEIALTYEESKPKFLDKIAGGWGVLNYFFKCLTEREKAHENKKSMSVFSGFISFLDKVINIWTLASLISIFASTLMNVVGLFILKGLKIAFWVLRGLYSAIKAYAESKKEKRNGKVEMRFWGVASGSVLRAVYTAVAPWERKK